MFAAGHLDQMDESSGQTSSHDIDNEFCATVCDKILELVKCLRSISRSSSLRDSDRTPTDGQESHRLNILLSDLLPQLGDISSLYSSSSSQYCSPDPLVPSVFDLLHASLKYLISGPRHSATDQLLCQIIALIVPFCLSFEPFISTSSEQQIDADVILELIRSHGEELDDETGGHLFRLLLDACFNHSNPKTPVLTNGLKATHTPDSFVTDSSELTISNDLGYDADDESRNMSLDEEAEQVLNHLNPIRLPKLAFYVLDVLSNSQTQMSRKTTDSLLVRSVDKLVDCCKECRRNALILYENGFPELVIKSLQNLMSPSASSYERTIVKLLSLFTAISRHRLRAKDLTSFMSLFTSGSQPPLKLLLNSLRSIVSQCDVLTPMLWLSTSNNLSIANGDVVLDLNTSRRTVCEKRNLLCCCTNAMAAVPLPDTCWPTKCLTASFWLNLRCDPTFKTRNKSAIIHLMSLSLGEFSLEVWYIVRKKVLSYRLISFQSWMQLFDVEETDPTAEQTPVIHNQWLHMSLTFLFERETISKIRFHLNGELRSLTCLNNTARLRPKVDASPSLFFGSNAKEGFDADVSCCKLFRADFDEMDASILFLMGPNCPLMTLSHSDVFFPDFPADRKFLKYPLIRCYMNKNERLDKLRNRVIAEFPIPSRSDDISCLFMSGTTDPSRQKINLRTHTISIMAPTNFSANNFTKKTVDLPYAIDDAGGVTSLLYLFGILIDRSKDLQVQADALSFLLDSVSIHPELQRDFAMMDGLQMLNQVIACNKCLPSRQLFEAYLKPCIVGKSSDSFLRSPNGLLSLFRSWRKWHPLPDAVDLIYGALLSLLMPSNQWRECNLFQLRQIGLMKEITCMLGSCFLDFQEQICFRNKDMNSLSQILKLLIGSPPDPSCISELVNCLTLLQDNSRAFISQSKRNMYFLLSGLTSEELNWNLSHSLTSTEEWQLIRPLSRTVHPETASSIVCAGLLNTLNDAIADLNNSEVRSVLGSVLKIDHFLVWSNNENGLIRDLVLKTLITSLKRVQAVDYVNHFITENSFRLLSCQLAQFKASADGFSHLLTFILDSDCVNLGLEDWTFARNWLKVTSVQAAAFQAFMSLIVQAQEDVNLAHWSLQCLMKLLKNIPNSSHVLKTLLDDGLVNCLINVVRKSEFNSQSKTDLLLDDDVIEKDVLSIFELLTEKLISSSGNIFREAFDETIDVLVLESLRPAPKKDILRQCLIMSLRTAFDFIQKRASDNKFSQSSFREDEARKENGSVTSQKEPEKFSLTREELDSRMRLVVERSIEAILIRDPGSPCPEIEKFFSRTLLHTLFLNSVGQRSNGHWFPLANPFHKFLRSKLSHLLVLSLSPVYAAKDRLQFALWICQSLPQNLSSCLNQKQLNVIRSFLPAIATRCSPAEEEALNRCLAFIPGDKVVDCDLWLKTVFERKETALVKIRTRHQTSYSVFETISEQIGEQAMTLTQSFVHEQNRERVKFFNTTKELERVTYATKKKWRRLVQSVIHEAHHFYDRESFPQSWQLDPCEGPSRMRRKLMRCHLDIEEQFFEPGSQIKSKCHEVRIPLSSVHDTTDQTAEVSILVDSIHAKEQILQTYQCALITPRYEYSGEILLSESCAHFIGQMNDRHQTPGASCARLRQETWILTDVKEFLERRYQLQDTAVELFLENGNSYLLAFKTPADLRGIIQFFSDRGISQTSEVKSLTAVTKLWRERNITNFDYLMFLNKLAGRSFNDLMIYPVYPFLVADYKSDILNLYSPASFRNFSKPMAIQQEGREKYYIEQYQYLLSEYNRRLASNDATLDPVSCPVYHYGSHYSNSGTVLHFLVRLPPFTQMFLNYQDHSFDIPDRTFHSMSVAWDLASGGSTTDFKELTPEFFYLPEFLTNFENFKLGNRHNGIKVNDVNLPSWCRRDPRLFVLINRQALESEYVSRNLHNWIDLIFGYKQSGKNAIEATNVFHPATYYGLEVNAIEDSLKRNALITMIRTFGQMPKQLFKHPHPQRLANNSGQQEWVGCQQVLGEVTGLRWGEFIGSPSEPDPVIVFSSESSFFRGCLVSLPTNDILGLPLNSCILVSFNYVKKKVKTTSPAYVSSLAVISWNHADGMIRVRDRMGNISTPFLSSCLHEVALCASLSLNGLIFVAFTSGAIAVHSIPAPYGSNLSGPFVPTTWLLAHKSRVTAIVLNKEFRISVTCDESGHCFLWDLNTLSYTRELFQHENSVSLVCVSPTLGDIATVSQSEDDSRLIVCTINGQLVSSLKPGRVITAICYSSSQEGVSVNVLVTGFKDGTIQMWSSWDLTPVRVLSDPLFCKPITSVCFFLDNNYLCVMNCEGGMRIWSKKGNPVVTSNPVTIL